MKLPLWEIKRMKDYILLERYVSKRYLQSIGKASSVMNEEVCWLRDEIFERMKK